MNTDIYKISNSKTICRTLPFFARGRKMILFLEAVASPLVSIHDAFLAWAFKMVLKTKVTSQTDMLVWYLNYLMRSHFKNGDDSFSIVQDFEIQNLVAYNYWEIAAFKPLGMRIYNTDEQEATLEDSKSVREYSVRMQSDSIIIYAPEINELESYTEQDYLAEIDGVMQAYKASVGEYTITIQSEQE